MGTSKKITLNYTESHKGKRKGAAFSAFLIPENPVY